MSRRNIFLGCIFIPTFYIIYLLLLTGFFSKLNLYPFYKYEGQDRTRVVYFSTSKPRHWTSIKKAIRGKRNLNSPKRTNISHKDVVKGICKSCDNGTLNDPEST